MKPDWYTKIVLTLIAVFLGMQVLDSHKMASVVGTAQAAVKPEAFPDELVDILPFGNVGFIIFDRRDGGVWCYSHDMNRGFQLYGPPGLIEKPGAGVQNYPISIK